MERYSRGLTVPASVIDALGHVNNIEYLRWVQDVALAHSESVGLDAAAYLAIGGVFVVRRHAVEYLREAREGDALTVTTWIESTRRIQCERATEITNAKSETVVTARTTWVYVARDSMRPARIPPEIRRRFGVPDEA